jgi:mannosyltransferase
MAIPRPIRLLAVVTLGLFCFLLIILFRDPATVNQPSGDHVKLETWERDPNLDRMDVIFPL